MRRGIEQHVRDRKDHEKLTREVWRHGSNISFEEICISPELVCQYCGRACLSKAGLINHSLSHNVGPLVECSNCGVAICHQCGTRCKSVPGLTRHMRVYGDSTTNPSAQSYFSCDYC